MSRDADRAALLEAGRSLALRCRLDEIDAVRLASEAGLPPEAFEQHYASLEGFVAALLQAFMEGVRDRIVKMTAGMAAGLPRIQLATEVYLGSCLDQRALRGWFAEPRAQAAVAQVLRRQNQPYWLVIAAELQMLRWPQPQDAARLFVAMANEVARAEQRMGKPVAELRHTLWDFLERAGPRAEPL